MTTWVKKLMSDVLGFIKTDDNFYVLVGEDEDEKLIWSRPTVWGGKTKNITMWSSVGKSNTSWSYKTKN